MAIVADQAMLIQFAEEKMALSTQCYDLVDMHLMQVGEIVGHQFDGPCGVLVFIDRRMLWQYSGASGIVDVPYGIGMSRCYVLPCRSTKTSRPSRASC